MSSIVESRIEDLENLKKTLTENIKGFENAIVELKKKISAINEEIQTLKDQ
jgi:prefoldin subunit 5